MCSVRRESEGMQQNREMLKVGGAYKLSTQSWKMALKLSRACGSTRDSGKLPFIASQTMGRLTAQGVITHTYTYTSDSAIPNNSASHCLHYSPAPSLCLLRQLLLSPAAARFHVVNIMQNNSFLFFPARPYTRPLSIPSLMGAKRCKLAERDALLYTHRHGYLPSLFIIVIIINALL